MTVPIIKTVEERVAEFKVGFKELVERTGIALGTSLDIVDMRAEEVNKLEEQHEAATTEE